MKVKYECQYCGHTLIKNYAITVLPNTECAKCGDKNVTSRVLKSIDYYSSHTTSENNEEDL